MKNKNRKRSSLKKKLWSLGIISQRLIRNLSKVATALSSQFWFGARWKQFVAIEFSEILETFLRECLTLNLAIYQGRKHGNRMK